MILGGEDVESKEAVKIKCEKIALKFKDKKSDGKKSKWSKAIWDDSLENGTCKSL